MICSGCYREVPDLLGPANDLCPECYGISAEDLVPSLLAAPPPHHGLSGGFWQDFAEDLANSLTELDEGGSFLGLDEDFDPDDVPLYGGKPRF